MRRTAHRVPLARGARDHAGDDGGRELVRDVRHVGLACRVASCSLLVTATRICRRRRRSATTTGDNRDVSWRLLTSRIWSPGIETTFSPARPARSNGARPSSTPLHALMTERAEDFFDALWKDLRRNRVDADVTDVKYVADEAAYARHHLRRWMHPQHVSTPLIMAPGRTEVRFDPLGVGLIIGAWNYPIMLSLVAAGGGDRGRECRGDQAVGSVPRLRRRDRPAGAAISRPRRSFRRGRRRAGDDRPARAGMGPHLLHRRSADRQGRHGRRGQEPDAGRARTGRQEPDRSCTPRRICGWRRAASPRAAG